jgi:hypothetical protein
MFGGLAHVDRIFSGPDARAACRRAGHARFSAEIRQLMVVPAIPA